MQCHRYIQFMLVGELMLFVCVTCTWLVCRQHRGKHRECLGERCTWFRAYSAGTIPPGNTSVHLVSCVGCIYSMLCWLLKIRTFRLSAVVYLWPISPVALSSARITEGTFVDRWRRIFSDRLDVIFVS